jgi:hypothetical protein
VSDALSHTVPFRSQGPLPSAQVSRRSAQTETIASVRRGLATATLTMGLVGGGPPAATAPILVKPHHVTVSDAEISISPAAFTDTAREARVETFRSALQDAVELSELMMGQDDCDPIDHQTFSYAVQSLLPFVVSLALPCPMMLPLQNGGIGAEWHDLGLNIELRFRKLYDVYAVVEDVRSIVSSYHGRDPYLRNIESALRELSRRFTV